MGERGLHPCRWLSRTIKHLNAAGVHPAPTQLGSAELTWGHRTYVMGVINVSPDSFSGDGCRTVEEAVEQGLRFVAEGADILDVGGQSTRPGAPAVPHDLELRRVLPVVEALASATRTPISVDTSHSQVARAAVTAGARMVNDVTGLLGDASMAEVIVRARAAAVVMANHRMKLEHDHSDGVVRATMRRWQLSLQVASNANLPPQQVILDPGLGFGLSAAGSLELLRRLHELRRCGHALLVGPSRKGFIGHALGGLPPTERLEGSLAAVALAIAGGADLVRAHDVRATHRARVVADAVWRA